MPEDTEENMEEEKIMTEEVETPTEKAEVGAAPTEAEFAEMKDRYLRLYAEFENYKKRVQKDREDLIKYSNENLIAELLPSIDHMEIALMHAEEKNGPNAGIVQGVEMTLREFLRTMEKFGLKQIESLGKPFDPEFHDAMAVVERDDVEDGTVIEEMRKGYLFKDKVLRAALVCVSRMPKKEEEDKTNAEDTSEEEE